MFDFGNLIAQKREDVGLSQESLGAILGVSNKAVSKWENGTALPSGDVLIKLCKELGISIDEAYSKIYPKKNKKVIKIILTGGPCAGKTTALSWINNAVTKKGYRVIFIPEVATELINAGYTKTSCDDFYSWQKGIIKTQIEKDNLYDTLIKNLSADKILIVYDRGVLDSKAYLGAKLFAKALKEIGVKEREIVSRVDAVFHLETAAKGNKDWYTLTNNTARSETPEEAIEIDNKIKQAYLSHPHLKIIGNKSNYEDKMKLLLKSIESVLGDPICYEIERKFLIEKPNVNLLIKKYNMLKSNISQTYIATNNADEIRVRQQGIDGDYVYTKTIKRGKGLKRVELEEKITQEEYLNLLSQADPHKRTINKVRYSMLYNNQYIELDFYPEESFAMFKDKAIMEIELNKEDQQIDFPKEIKVIKDVTEDDYYKNTNLASLT